MKRALQLSSRLVALGVLVLALGCQPRIVGSGIPETRELKLADFTRLEVGHAFDAEVERGEPFRVEVTVDDNLVPYLLTDVDKGTLRVRFQQGYDYTTTGDHMRLRVRLPRLDGLEASGASRVELRGFDQADTLGETLRLDASGASRVEGALSARTVVLEASGASSFRLTGRAEALKAEVSGASELELVGLQVEDAEVSLSGASQAEVDVRARLKVEASGASDLTYRGSPELVRLETSGASSVKRIEVAAPAAAPAVLEKPLLVE